MKIVEQSQIHKGHRQRLKERFCREGLASFNEINALEILLFYCIPKQDTNEIAHALLERFGTFANVLDAPRDDLLQIKGVGEHVVTFLKLITQARGYYYVSQANSIQIVNTYEGAGNYLMRRFEGLKRESIFVLCLDAKCKVLGCEKVGEGGINSANVPVRKIVETALKYEATSVIIAHNHPSGVALPSDEDRRATIHLAQTLRGVDITLLDHIIVADEEYISMALSNLYNPDNINALGYGVEK